MPHDYADPVARLLEFGSLEARRMDAEWPDYLELGFTRDHVPELLRMARDDALAFAPSDSPEVWAPLHAWRAVAQLGAVEAAPALVRLLQRFPDDDWLCEDLPRVLSLLGPASIDAVADFLADRSVGEMAQISAPACLERIAADHPAHRDACVRVLERQLARHAANGDTLNAFLISSLIDLGASESIGTIREAFAAGHVDFSVLGDLEDAEIALGLRHSRITPPPKIRWFREPSRLAGGEADLTEELLGPGPGPITNPFRHVGRNDPCPCNSGRKFKRCCGRD